MLLTLVMTANCANMSRILNQIPIFSALSATALLVSQTNFWASNLISTQLLRRAKNGAKGKAATKMVIKPNWRTWQTNININIIHELSKKKHFTDPFPSILEKVLHSPPVCNRIPFVIRQFLAALTGIKDKNNTKSQNGLEPDSPAKKSSNSYGSYSSLMQHSQEC